MELVQLKYFRALAETENLTQTARKLHLSAPALSESISKLERELGIALFDHIIVGRSSVFSMVRNAAVELGTGTLCP